MGKRMQKGLMRLSCAVVALILMFGFVGWSRGAAKPSGRKAAVKEAPAKKPVKEATPRKGHSADTAPTVKGIGIDASPGPIDSKSAMMVEVSTGAKLLEYNADLLIEPASFTKVMTLYLLFERIREGKVSLKDELWVSEEAWRTGGSKMFVGVGSKVPLEELIKGITVVSGNDACVAVAEHLSGSIGSFAEAMNNKAKELGMTNSHFVNPHGLPAQGQATTSRDMATLGASYLRRFPEAIRYHSMREYTYNGITQYNRNHLILKDPSVDGLKTGFVDAAGYHLSATAQRDGMRLLAVVMGAANPGTREREAMKLLNFGFRHYALVHPFADGQPIVSAKIWKGEKSELGLYPLDAASVLVPEPQRNALKWDVRVREDITAPISENQPLGELVFTLADSPVRTVSLVSREEVPLGPWYKRLWHSIVQLHTVDWRWPLGIVVGLLALVGGAILVLNRRSMFRGSGSHYGR